MAFEEQVKAFAMTNMLIESDLDKVQEKYQISLRMLEDNVPISNEITKAYFPQFEKSLRDEAASMASSYELFYCLEKTIRKQIAELLEDSVGSNWWNEKIVPQVILLEVKKRIQKEKESAITPRSTDALDFTTFGELGEIIKMNWSVFSGIFNNLKAVEKVMLAFPQHDGHFR